MRCPHCAGTGELELDKVTVGAMVLAARKAAGLTQLELSHRCGLGRAQIANIEADRSDVLVRTLTRIADGLGVKAGSLIP